MKLIHQSIRSLALLTASVLVSCPTAMADTSGDDGIHISYCNGEVSTSGQIKVTGEETIQAAIYLPAEALAVYKGNSISAVNAGLASKLNISDLSVWVRSDLNGPDICSGSPDDGKAAKGWNTIALDKAWSISGEEGIYVGYTYTQAKTTYGISTVGQYTENGIFVKLGDSASWTSPEEYGVLSIEAIITGNELPSRDLALISASIPDKYAVNSYLPVEFTVKNLAPTSVSTFTLTAKVLDDSKEVTSASQTFSCDLGNGSQMSAKASFSFENLEAGKDYTLLVTVSDPDGEADSNPANDSATLSFLTVAKEFKKMIVVEEFTTENCVNCPRVAGWLHDTIDGFSEEEQAQVGVACHHAGFGTDYFTHEADESYTWLYNCGASIYAPAMMVDRTTYPGTDSPVFLPETQEEMEASFRKAMAQPAYVDLNINASFDPETLEIKVEVKGERTFLFSEASPRITVYALQDNIKALSQSGAEAEYYHNHVLRALNSVWGDIIEWDGDDYKYDCTLSISRKCKPENMYLLAFVNDYDPENPNACTIYNAARLSFNDFSEGSGVTAMEAEESLFIRVEGSKVVVDGNPDSVEVYDINGRTADYSSLAKGFYIVKASKGNHTTSAKIAIR